MKTFSILLAALLIATPAFARDRERHERDGDKVKVYRDDDHDGHYAKKGEYYVGNRGRHGGYYGGHRRHYNRPYYNNYHYGRPYYGYGYSRYYRPSVGISVTRPIYRDRYVTNNSLEASVQRALRRQGYYRGPIDGDLGPGSRAAIRNYQADNGLRVTGRVDNSLIRSLGV